MKNKRSKKAYICGYYGMQNSGDDALLYATVNGARNHLDTDRCDIHTPHKISLPNIGSFEPRISDEQRYRGENRILQCFNALRSDQVIFGGGSVLHCKRDMEVKTLMMRLAGKGPHLALGVGIEDFDSVAAERACRKFLNRCDYVGVRDKASYDVATSIAPSANIELTFDLAPSLLPVIQQTLAMPRSSISNPALSHHNRTNQQRGTLDLVEMQSVQTRRRGIGVLLCPRESIKANSTPEQLANEKQRVQDLALALTEIYQETGQPIYIYDMNGHDTLGDKSIHDELETLLPRNVPVFRYGYQANPLRLIAQLSRLNCCIAMRLHGSIFSYLADTPVMSVNYHDKCVGWCDQIGMPEHYRFDASGIDVNRLYQQVAQGVQQTFKQCTLGVEQAYELSLKNFVTPKNQYAV